MESRSLIAEGPKKAGVHAIHAAGFSLAVRGEKVVDSMGGEPRGHMEVPLTLGSRVQAMILIRLRERFREVAEGIIKGEQGRVCGGKGGGLGGAAEPFPFT